MSDLAYHIATEHKLRFHEPSLTTTCSLPTCGMEPRFVYDESSLAAVRIPPPPPQPLDGILATIGHAVDGGES